MYDPGITSRAVAKVSERIGFELQYHSQPQIVAAKAVLNEMVDLDRGGLKRNLAPDEQRFIDNERTLCALDARYYYANYCNPPEAPVWMADGTYKPIGEIRPGDQVVGWAKPIKDDYRPRTRFDRDHYHTATVIAVQRRIAPIVNVVMESGRTIRCSYDHLWSNGNSARTQNPQKSTRKGHGGRYRILWTKAKVGAKLRWSRDPVFRGDLPRDLQDTASWLGGVFDGEGSVTKAGFSIAQSKAHNPDVYEAIATALRDLGFQFRSTEMGHYVTGGIREMHRFLVLCRPVRRKKILHQLTGQVHCRTDRIVSVVPAGDGEVVSMQTTTGNYVVWGYLSKNCYIINWEKEPQLFTLNVAQRMMLDIWGELEREAKAIHCVQLKARRLGVSTLSEMEIARRVQFLPFTNAVVASADPTKSVIMADMIDFAWRQMPWWLMPKTSKIQGGMPVEFAEIDTGITIQAGNQFNGVARGATPSAYHVSEISEWVDAEDLIEASLLRAIIDQPNIFGIIEGTGRERDSYFYKLWQRIKRDWPRGRSRQIGVFLPWFVGTDIYPSPAERRNRPIPKDWVPSDRTIQHAEKARKFVLSNPYLLKYLAKGDLNWKMPPEQMWYREVEYESAREAKTLNKFLSEMCADDFEAFQATNIPIVDPEIIISYRENARQPLAVYGIIGPDIPPMLLPPRRQWDASKPSITIHTRDVVPNLAVSYQLVPLQFQGYDSFDPDLKLLIWEEPRQNTTYGGGCDCGEGIQQDRTVFEVLREATPWEPPAQVAEFASDRVTAFQMWPIAMAIGCYYSVYQERLSRRSQIRMVIEAFTNGAALQRELQKRGWSNFHGWQYNDTRKTKPEMETQRIGVYTNAWFRSQMMDMLLTCLSEEAIDLPSPYLVDELETLERKSGQRKIQAASSKFDDRLMALGFPLFSLHQNKPPSKQYARRRVEYEPGFDSGEIKHYPIWQPGSQETGAFAPAQQILRGRQGRPNGLHRLVNQRMPRGYR